MSARIMSRGGEPSGITSGSWQASPTPVSCRIPGKQLALGGWWSRAMCRNGLHHVARRGTGAASHAETALYRRICCLEGSWPVPFPGKPMTSI